MATAINCLCCGSTVALKNNTAGKAYYHCGFCDLSVQSKGKTSSDKLHSLGDAAHTPRQKPETAPAPAPAPAPRPATTKAAGGFQTLMHRG